MVLRTGPLSTRYIFFFFFSLILCILGTSIYSKLDDDKNQKKGGPRDVHNNVSWAIGIFFIIIKFCFTNKSFFMPSDVPAMASVATTTFQMGLGHPREPSCYNPGYERNGFLSFVWMLRLMPFHSFIPETISIISIKPGEWYLAGGPLEPVKSFISFVFFISFRMWDPIFLLFLSFLPGCRILYFFHFFCYNFR